MLCKVKHILWRNCNTPKRAYKKQKPNEGGRLQCRRQQQQQQQKQQQRLLMLCYALALFLSLPLPLVRSMCVSFCALALSVWFCFWLEIRRLHVSQHVAAFLMLLARAFKQSCRAPKQSATNKCYSTFSFKPFFRFVAAILIGWAVWFIIYSLCSLFSF